MRCSHCGKEGSDLLRCSRCKVAHYCDSVCQRQAWRLHKPECTKEQTAAREFKAFFDEACRSSKHQHYGSLTRWVANIGGPSKWMEPSELRRMRLTGEHSPNDSSYTRLDRIGGLPLELMLRVWRHLPRWWRYGVVSSVCSSWWLANHDDPVLWEYVAIVQRKERKRRRWPTPPQPSGEVTPANPRGYHDFMRAGALLLMPHEIFFLPTPSWVKTLAIVEPYVELEGPFPIGESGFYRYFTDEPGGSTFPDNVFREGGLASPSVEALCSWKDWPGLCALRLPVGEGTGDFGIDEDSPDYEKEERFHDLIFDWLNDADTLRMLKYLDLPGDAECFFSSDLDFPGSLPGLVGLASVEFGDLYQDWPAAYKAQIQVLGPTNYMGDEDLIKVFRHFPNLRRLSFKASSFEERTVHAICNEAPQTLEALYIEADTTGPFCTQVWAQFASFPRLKELVLHHDCMEWDPDFGEEDVCRYLNSLMPQTDVVFLELGSDVPISILDYVFLPGQHLP